MVIIHGHNCLRGLIIIIFQNAEFFHSLMFCLNNTQYVMDGQVDVTGSGGAADGWTNSRRLCQDQGGDLAVMETRELWQFVAENSAALRYNLLIQSVGKTYFVHKFVELNINLSIIT